MPSEQDVFDELRELCKSPGFIHAVAYFCFRDDVIKVPNEKFTEKHLENLYSPERLIRTEVTTLIGLMMRNPIDFFLPKPETVQDYIDRATGLLEELHQTLILPSFEQVQKVINSQNRESNPLQSGEFLREVIFYGGESAYPFQFRDFAPMKYKKDAPWLLENKRVNIEISVDIFKSIEAIFNNRVIDLEDRLKATPVKEWTMLPLFTFSIKEIADHSGHLYGEVESFIDAFTLPDGERNETFNSLNDFNIACAYPFIKMGPEELVLLQYFGFAEAFFDTPFYWMCEDEKYYPIASQNRGEFTEAFSHKRLSSVFGDHVYKNVKLVDSKNNAKGEIDVLVVFGDHAIVLQAKSKRLTLESRKGNDGSIRDDFKKAVKDAVDQAILCSELLSDSSVTIKSGNTILNFETFPQVIFPVTVVSDHYPGLKIQSSQFLEFSPTETISAPMVTDIFTLDIMAEMLDSPLRFLSYLKLHARYIDRVFMNHEITALSYHLSKNLWVQGNELWHLSDDLCAPLDIAMAVRREGIEGDDTPKGILTDYIGTPFERLISHIEDVADPVAVRFGMLLLEVSGKTVEMINRQVTRIVTQVKEDGQPHDITLYFDDPLSSGFTIHCSKKPRKEAADWLHMHCQVRKYLCQSDKWFGATIRPDESILLIMMIDYPWERSQDMENLIKDLIPDSSSILKSLEAQNASR